VIYAKAFFDLQLRFADRVARLSGMPLARALLEYTNLYIRLGLGRDFDPAHPTWQEYLAGLQDTSDRPGWTWGFHARRPKAGPPVVATFGCFSYARVSDDRIRLHFENAEPDGHSPLGLDRHGRRLADLAALFEHVKRTEGGPLWVAGASWLYNLEAYRRLFPGSYVATARAIAPRFQRMPLWGQFLDRRGEVRASRAGEFLDRLAREASLAGLGRCFPLPVLAAEAAVGDFYEFYGI
jgi:hypothetical protein